MRRLRGIAVATGLTLALIGCSQQTDLPLAATPATPDTPLPSAALRVSDPTQAAPKLTPSQTIGLQSTPWELLSAAGTTLNIRYVAGGGCSKWAGVRVLETERTVELWTTTRPPKGDPACLLILNVNESTIILRKPLGFRTLLHAPVSSNWTTYEGRF